MAVRTVEKNQKRLLLSRIFLPSSRSDFKVDEILRGLRGRKDKDHWLFERVKDNALLRRHRDWRSGRVRQV
jgi:hypothetical protein